MRGYFRVGTQFIGFDTVLLGIFVVGGIAWDCWNRPDQFWTWVGIVATSIIVVCGMMWLTERPGKRRRQ